MTEGATHVIVSRVDFFMGVRDAQVPDPDAVSFDATGELEVWFCFCVGPVINSEAPRSGAESAVKDGARILVLVVYVYHAKGSQVCIINEKDDAFVCCETEVLLEVLDKGFPCGLWFDVDGFVVAVFVKFDEILFC
jgi:hypothetical protein